MTKASERVAHASVIDLLEQDHEQTRKVLAQLEKAADPDRRAELFAQVKQMLVLHAKAEEMIFYPAYRDAAESKEDRKVFFEAHEEHALVDIVIADLDSASPESDAFAAKAKVLKDLVEHHAEEEEEEMFPRARKLLDKDELIDLGSRIEAFKREAESRR